MQTKSAAFTSALVAPSVEWQYGVDILAADGATALEDPTIYDEFAADRLMPKTGQITLDTTAKSQRTFALNLRNGDGRYLPGPAGFPSGGQNSPIATGLVWYTARYRPWIKLRTGFDASGSKQWDTTYLGVFALSSPTTQATVQQDYITLSLIDLSSLLCKPFCITQDTLPTYTLSGATVGGYASGTSFDSAMMDLASRVGIPSSVTAFEPSALTLATDYSITEGDEPWAILQGMATAMGHVLYFDFAGNLIRRPDPTSINAPSVYTFSPGPASIISTVQRVTDLSNTYNHVIVLGGSSTTALVRGEAQILDTSNPYHKDNIGERIAYVDSTGGIGSMTPDPNISTTAQANTVAGIFLANHIGQQETLTITGRTIPNLDVYDRVTINVPGSGLALDFLVTGCQFNLSHDGMTITASRFLAVGS